MNLRTMIAFVGIGLFLGILSRMNMADQARAELPDHTKLYQLAQLGGIERRELEKREVEKREVEKRELERRAPVGRDLERREVETRELERRAPATRELERRDLEKRELERRELERR